MNSLLSILAREFIAYYRRPNARKPLFFNFTTLNYVPEILLNFIYIRLSIF